MHAGRRPVTLVLSQRFSPDIYSSTLRTLLSVSHSRREDGHILNVRFYKCRTEEFSQLS